MSFPRELRCESCGYHALWSPEPVAAAIPRDEQGRIWLLRRTLHEGAGRWTFPGGYVELGESAEEAVTREAKEEMGVDVRIDRLLGLHSGAPSAVAVALYEGTIIAGEPEPLHEVDAVGFFRPEEAPEVAFWSTHWALDLWRLESRDRRLRR